MSSKEASGNGKDPLAVVVKESSHPAEGSPKEDSKNRGWPKGKKRYPKSPGAPKQPLSGYVHFLNHRRDSVRKEFPEMSFADISKKLAQEWSQLDASEKQTYVKKAEEDKERYNREFSEYQLTDAYKQFLATEKDKEKQHHDVSSAGAGSNPGTSGGSGSKKKKSSSKEKVVKMEEQETTNPESPPRSGSFLEIPIFRDEFLEHNKAREAELKQLRKQAIEFEEQNAILQKHVENMKSAIAKLEQETGQQQENNLALEKHLDALRKLVIVNFGGLTLPTPTTPGSTSAHGPLCLDNVDDFVQHLHSLVVDKPKENERLVATVKEISRKIDYSSVST